MPAGRPCRPCRLATLVLLLLAVAAAATSAEAPDEGAAAREPGRVADGTARGPVRVTPVADGAAHEPGRATPAPDGAAREPGRVTLEADAAAHAGIATVQVAAASAPSRLEAFGRVLDPLPLVEALHARAAARASAAAARSEYERVQRLHDADRNASTRDLEAARAALARADVELGNAAARATLAWGAADASEALADDLVGGRAALARIDLPAGEHLASVPPTVAVAAIGRPERRLAARVLGRAPTVDPAVQGEAYLALVTGTPPAPGTALVATVERPEAPSAGVSVPAAAVLWSDGRSLVYVQSSPAPSSAVS